MPKEFFEHIDNFMIENKNYAKYAEALDGIIPYMQQQFELERRQYITPTFVQRCFAEFSNTSVDAVTAQLKLERPRREGVDYTRKPRSKPSSCGNILSMLAESAPEPAKFALLRKDEGLIPQTTAFKNMLGNEIVRTPTQLRYDSTKNTWSGVENNTPYGKKLCTNDKFTLLGQKKPCKAIRFAPIDINEGQMREKYPQLYNTSDKFEFTVTKSQVIDRLNKKRGVSQRQVMGFTAEEIFREFGAVIIQFMGKSGYHLAHRHGWGLGGAQRGINMDVGTAGSNYHTLFCVEDPIRQLLMSEDNTVEAVTVEGDVVFHEDTPIPEKITYRLFWDDKCQYECSIYPTDHTKPTMGENTVAKAFLKTLTF